MKAADTDSAPNVIISFEQQIFDGRKSIMQGKEMAFLRSVLGIIPLSWQAE